MFTAMAFSPVRLVVDIQYAYCFTAVGYPRVGNPSGSGDDGGSSSSNKLEEGRKQIADVAFTSNADETTTRMPSAAPSPNHTH